MFVVFVNTSIIAPVPLLVERTPIPGIKLLVQVIVPTDTEVGV
jgi:hypothetical protein